ncbi:ras-related and estrogen-regulated growth inhibitor-like [Actinia tenebrosa]|uniref:small monomeric GTPase n=1 Tax=Actinia tenebrosa TaxID=6105 RepID=A0A6P8JGJ2_ACTTE|nr:ras-related and estrogen-regulated growth inhibitor-like [Actinia tenebrosa]
MKRKDANPGRRRKQSVVQSNVKPVKIVILGSVGVGKSALTVRLLTRRFIGEYDVTLESTHRHQIEIDNEFIIIELTDTAGENSAVKLNHCMNKGDIFLLVYSITDHKTFDEAKRIANYIKDRKNADSTTMTLVGTKRDLEHFRSVNETEGSELAKELDSGFYELSISDRDGYQEVVDMVKACVRQHLKREKQERQQKTNNSSLGKMKEGLIRKTGSLRRKSVAF